MADAGFEHVTQTFLVWLVERGVKMSPKMTVVDFRAQGRGRGIVALEDFDEDEVIFSVPRDSILNIRTAEISPQYESLGISKETLANMPSWLSLTIIMMCEALQSQSTWSPYFAILPSELDALVFWTPKELEELQASAVISKIGKGKAEEIFRRDIETLGMNDLTIDCFHRIASTIMAYAFDVPEEESEEEPEDENGDDFIPDEDQLTLLSMIPLADLLNADAHWNNARLSCDSKDLEMRAIKSINKGEEIFNDYGPLPRSDLLRRYGYVTDRYAPYDVVEISTDSILASFRNGIYIDHPEVSLEPLTTSELETRLDLAKREDVFEDSYDIRRGLEGHCISNELVALVYFLLLDQETFHTLESSSASLPSRSKMCTELLGTVLAELLRKREREYATTWEEDQEILQNNTYSPRKFAAVKVRQGEKKVLREAVQEVTSFQGSNRRMRINSEKRAAENKVLNPIKRSKHR